MTNGGGQPQTSRPKSPKVTLAVIAVFAALIALLTSIFSIPLPPPVYEITLAPAVYLALAAMVDPYISGSAIGLGSFIGEAYNIATKPNGSPIYPFGMLWARVPEALIVWWARDKGRGVLIMAMVAATMFETVAFFLSDWAFYYYGVFNYSTIGGFGPGDLVASFTTAASDILTVVDIAFIPVALAIIKGAKPAFARLGFTQI
jgi:uncharacterized membrane protein